MSKEQTENKLGYAASFSEQFTVRAVVIGSVGAVILTMSSMYVALKLGALPWPIIFVAMVSMFFLKLLGNTNFNEINVAHTTMSAGAMTAGGLSFTIPGLYMLNPEAGVNFVQLLTVVLGGVVLGLIFTILIREYFIETQGLPYPMGTAAAEAVISGDAGGKKSAALFGSMGFAAVFTVLRDWFAVIPQILPSGFIQRMAAYGSLAGVWVSPMLVGIGYIIGPVFIVIWFLGALIGDVGILIGGVKTGLWNGETAATIKASLGIGLMVGTGAGIVVKGILPRIREIFGPMFSRDAWNSGAVNMRWAPVVMAALAFIFTAVCDMGITGSVITILGVWLATAMSAQICGQTGINPMEVFGIIIMLVAKAASPGMGQTAAFFTAAVVAVACGLAGDVMNDFKAGYILKTDPKAQWLGECVGGVIGAFVSVGVFYVILRAYGPAAFGDPEMFIAPQAGMVAAMVGGISHMPAFLAGLGAGVALYMVNFPVMTLGLGVYLPFYLSATALIGGLLKYFTAKTKSDENGTGRIIASGVLGGETVIGVVIAMIHAVSGIIA